jgi:type III pantothenate kinase
MLLAVDIGNTNVTFGIWENGSLLHTFRASTVLTRTADEYAILIHQMLTLRGVVEGRVQGAIIASVVPPLTETFVNAIRAAYAREPLIVGPGLKTGMPIHYENPREVGADRIVNSVAAFDRLRQAVIVVDFGTATTFDCISHDGEYLGGVIVPGILVSLDGLFAHAAKLSHVEIAEPPRVLGRNTAHALQSGIVFGYASLVDGLVQRLRTEMGGQCRTLATGGLAPLVTKHAKTIETVDLDLTLQGLHLLYQRNCLTTSEPASGSHRQNKNS